MLVVEDDPQLRELYWTELTMAGYTVVLVSDGVTALQRIDADRPDVIVLDWGLPRLSGADLQRELAAHPETRGIPIVLVTGLAAEKSINPADFWCVIRKPFDPRELVERVKECIPPSRGSLFSR